MNIYVGNLAYSVTEDDLRSAFQGFGEIMSVNIIKDKFSGQSKGFGFVEMPSAEEARSAINEMNGKEFKGRALNVNEARPRTEGGSSRGGGRGFGGPMRGGRGGHGGGGGGRRTGGRY
ncbi:MAG TPA: RNA-binding protein [Deltaproteobacteria bacterium]|nr:RNA-binding protein [Deltaproteobacteria bacterium]